MGNSGDDMWKDGGGKASEGPRGDPTFERFLTFCLRAIHYAGSARGKPPADGPGFASPMLYHRAYGRDLDTLLDRRHRQSPADAVADAGHARRHRHGPNRHLRKPGRSPRGDDRDGSPISSLPRLRCSLSRARLWSGPCGTRARTLSLVPAMIMSTHAKPPSSRKCSGQGRIRCWCCRPRRARSIAGSIGC